MATFFGACGGKPALSGEAPSNSRQTKELAGTREKSDCINKSIALRPDASRAVAQAGHIRNSAAMVPFELLWTAYEIGRLPQKSCRSAASSNNSISNVTVSAEQTLETAIWRGNCSDSGRVSRRVPGKHFKAIYKVCNGASFVKHVTTKSVSWRIILGSGV